MNLLVGTIIPVYREPLQIEAINSFLPYSVAGSGVTVEANATKFKEMPVMPELAQWKTMQQSKGTLPHILAGGQMPFIMAPLANNGDFASEPGGK